VVNIPCEEFTLEAEARLLDGAPCAVVCHPHPAFGGRFDTPLVIALAEALAAAGLSTVRFNFRGLDGSGGTPTGGHREHEDVRAVCAWVRARGAPRVSLVGYSFGALMAMKAIAAGEPAHAFAAVGFPTSILGEHADRLADVDRSLRARVPALFVSGSDDPFCDLGQLRGWVDAHSHARLVIVDGGHFFSGEPARDLCARVADFVREVS
jgi:alpha/beta superfamily hydrolase